MGKTVVFFKETSKETADEMACFGHGENRMSNIISFDERVTPDDDSLVMSNGGTDVLISVLALSGSVIAQTENEKRLMVCKECDLLADGMCRACGFFVDMWAALDKNICPYGKWPAGQE